MKLYFIEYLLLYKRLKLEMKYCITIFTRFHIFVDNDEDIENVIVFCYFATYYSNVASRRKSAYVASIFSQIEFINKV